MAVMTNTEFVKKCVDAAKNYKTLYVMGCIGAPMNSANKLRYTNNCNYNKKTDRKNMILAATADTFGFDCVCFIKSILWGWNGDKNKTYGGAKYASNGVPDISADGMINVCSGVSKDFSNIEIGEVVWMSGHIGVYIGDGLAVECTPKWGNKVQITAVSNICKKAGYNARKWTKHGKLPCVTYEKKTDEPIHVKYRAYAGKWWGEIVDCNDKNSNGYAGVNNRAMTALMAKADKGKLRYRVHLLKEKRWLNWIEGYNTKDSIKGYAGNIGQEIDAVQMELTGLDGYVVQYRVSAISNTKWYGWCTNKTDATGDGYAGVFGKPIDCIQVKIVKKA
jgi:hypothetical protein